MESGRNYQETILEIVSRVIENVAPASCHLGAECVDPAHKDDQF